MEQLESKGARGGGKHGGVVSLKGIPALRASLAFSVNPIACLETYSERHGPIISVELGQARGRANRAVILKGPDLNKEVLLATDHVRPTGVWPVRGPPGSAQANLRATYLTSHGPDHQALAFHVGKALERPVVQKHVTGAKRIAQRVTGDWPTGEVVDVHRLARELSQEFAFGLIFGEADRSVSLRFGAMLAAYHQTNWNLAAQVAPLNLPGFPYRNVLRQAEALQSFILEWMEAVPSCPHANIRSQIAEVSDLEPKRAAAHLAGLALAAYETAAATQSWVLALLAIHTDVLEPLVEEVDAVGPIADAPISAIDALPRLDGVIKETMRLITPVPFLGFKTTQDRQFAGLDLARDTTLIISPHLTHRMGELYSDPRRFKPERWRTIRPNTYEYLPFSGGPRRCPGYLFALNNLKISLATILQKFRFDLAPSARIDYTYAGITGPASGLPMVLHKRTGPTARTSSHQKRRGSFFELFDHS